MNKAKLSELVQNYRSLELVSYPELVPSLIKELSEDGDISYGVEDGCFNVTYPINAIFDTLNSLDKTEEVVAALEWLNYLEELKVEEITI